MTSKGNEAGHTPTPWSVDPKAATAVRGKDYVIASTGGHQDNRRDADELWTELTANAAHIVQCVNERDSLLSQVKELQGALATFRERAQKAAELNDADHIKGNAIKAHKIIMALAGRIPGYRPEIDAAHALLTEKRT